MVARKIAYSARAVGRIRFLLRAGSKVHDFVEESPGAKTMPQAHESSLFIVAPKMVDFGVAIRAHTTLVEGTYCRATLTVTTLLVRM
jgi:hypothetical protein